MSKKQIIGVIIVAMALLAIAAVTSHPLVDHWGQTASSGASTFGSKWIHTDTSGYRHGLWGESASNSGRGIGGLATSSTGVAIGVEGKSYSNSGRGVHGFTTNGSGVSHGVTGQSSSTTTQASGVYGYNLRTTGDTRGVQGSVSSSTGTGVAGFLDPTGAGNGSGVYGQNDATSGTGVGVYGYNRSPSGWGGNYDSVGHGVRISSGSGKTGLVVYNGSKSAAVPTSDGDRLLYNEEATEVWFTDYGFGQLVNGQALVEIDPIYAETVNLDEGYHVFIQAYGDAEIFVSERTPSLFEVRANADSHSLNLEFSYRIVAKRLGFEDQRLDFAPWVDDENPYYVMPDPLHPPPMEDGAVVE